jgi:signal peptidase I
MKPFKAIIDFVMDILETVVFIGSLFIVVYLFLMQPNQVKGESMFPTFSNGDYILTSKITYKLRDFQRGDVIVFKSPKNPDIDYIKRIIALPGDRILFKDSKVYVNDTLITENYLSAPNNLWETGFAKEGQEIIVPQNNLFVMGDNRPHSSDSREFGPIHFNSVIGQVFYRYFPPNKVGFIHNPLPASLRTKK